MRVKSVLLLAVMATLTATLTRAEQLGGPEIRSLITGKTVRLSTPLGISLPLRYGSNGVVAGDISGFSMASMFAPKEEGRWWIDDGRLCQKWPSWYKGRTFCFTIKKLDTNRISWLRDDGASGTAVIASRTP